MLSLISDHALELPLLATFQVLHSSYDHGKLNPAQALSIYTSLCGGHQLSDA